jgi:hypothetical protein
MVSSGMLRHVALVRTDVSQELSAPFIKVTRIGELGTTLAVTTTDARCEEIPSKKGSQHGILTWYFFTANLGG